MDDAVPVLVGSLSGDVPPHRVSGSFQAVSHHRTPLSPKTGDEKRPEEGGVFGKACMRQ